MSIEESWNRALEDLDPRVQNALNALRTGKITERECDAIIAEVYPVERTPIEEVISAKTKEMFGKFLAGEITHAELQAFVEKLNQDPNSVL